MRFQIRCTFCPKKDPKRLHILSNDTLCNLYEVIYCMIQFQSVFRHFGLTFWQYFLTVLIKTFKNDVRQEWG